MGQILIPALTLFVIALVLTVVFVPLVRKLAIRIGATDKPSARRVNTREIPRMGGVAMFVAISAAFLVARFGHKLFGWPILFTQFSHRDVNYTLLFLAFVIMFVTGVLDDIFTLKPIPKLLGQILAACIAASAGLLINRIANPFGAPSYFNLGMFAYPITVIYLVSYVNIINLIDGLDGLAAGITCIASSTMFVLALWAGNWDTLVVAVAVCGATLGFLRYNYHPASIFMGDSGSLMLGFALGSMSLLNVTRMAALTTIIVPLVVAGIPIIDTASAIIRRSRAHVSFTTADRGHIHHRLMQEGFDQTQTVLVIYGWTALLCFGALLMMQVETLPRMMIFVLLAALSAIFISKLHLLDPVLLHFQDPETGADELVCPQDPEFDAAKEAFVEEQEAHHHLHLHGSSAEHDSKDGR